MNNEITIIVEKINEALGPQAEMLIQQYVASNTIYAIVYAIFALGTIWLAVYVKNRILNYDFDDEFDQGMLLTIGGILSFGTVILFWVAAIDSMVDALYPELNMLQSLMGG